MKSVIGQVRWVLLVVFLTSGSSSVEGQDCGGEFLQQSGLVTSPDYPNNYPNNKRCQWTVRARTNEIVDLRFNRLDLDGTSSNINGIGDTCPDYARVYDGDSASSPLLATMCRIKNTTELAKIIIRSTSNVMFIVFQSDYQGQRPGFVASYWSHECSAFSYGAESCNNTCTCVKDKTAYCNNTNGECVCKKGWTSSDCSQDVDECQIPPKVELCPSDYTECANNIGSFDCVCKAGLIQNSAGECEVKPESVCDQGHGCSHFCVKISGQQQCYCPDNMKLVGNNCQACSNVAFGKDCRLSCDCVKNNTQSCDTTTGGCICSKGWTSLDCSEDINECDNLLEKACPNANEQCVNTPGGYQCGCSSTFTNPSGVVQSPSYPNNAAGGVRCNWTIVAGGSGNTIAFSVSDMRTSYNEQYRETCSYGSAEIYDGSNSSYPLLGRYCGYYTNAGIIRSSGDTMFIVFQTTSSTPRLFKGTYSTSAYQVVKTITTDPSGIIASPGFPVSSSSNVAYSWTITVPSNKVVNFSISELGLGDCGKDFIDIYDGNHPGANRLIQLCGNSRPRTFVSTNRSMHIIYSHEGSTSGKGFTGSYLTDACWCYTSYTQSCNYLTGPCVCKSGVTGSYCNQDINECQSNPCPAHSSCYNQFGSFKCTCWNGTIVNVNGSCDDWAQTLYGPSGNIQSQGFPSRYPQFVNYTWSIVGKGKEVVTLRFKQFDVEALDRCYNDAVEIYDGAVSDSKLIGQYCGKIVPGLLRSTKPVMSVYFKTSNSIYSYSTIGYNGTYYVHECPLFMYGEEKCTSHCSCAYDTTRVCDNTNGVCFCKTGWVGSGCSQDLDECRNPSICTKNSECINSPGSYSCECIPGFVMGASGLCEASSHCSEEMKQKCSHFCDVDKITKVETCYCPEDFVLLEDDATCGISLYPHGPAAEDDSAIVQRNGQLRYLDNDISFNSLVPFGKVYQNNARIVYNGAVMFSQPTIMSFPNLDMARSNMDNLIAPFWTENRKIGPGEVFYHVYDNCSSSLFNGPGSSSVPSPRKDQVMARAIRDLKLFHNLPDFEISLAFVVTWNNVETKDCRGYTNTFQAVLVSGHTPPAAGQSYLEVQEKSYVIFLYKDGSGICQEGQPFEVGTVSQSGVISADVDKDDPRLPQTIGNTGNRGVHSFEVGKKHSESLMCQRYLCKHADLIGNPHFQAEINELYQCPCSLDNLGLQWQFLKDEGDTKCYAIREVAKRRLLRTNQRNRVCCYSWTTPKSDSYEDWHESWIAGSFIPTGQLLVTDPWPGSQSLGSSNPFKDAVENMQARTWCCEKSSSEFCNRFNKVFGDPQCTIHPVFVPTIAFGDPTLTTLDGKEYLMNGWGEYNLVQVPSKNFTLQARTEKVVINGKLSNGTVFTGFAAQEGTGANVQVLLDTTGTSMVLLANGNDFTNRFYRDPSFIWSTASASVQRSDEGSRIVAVVTFECGVSYKVHLGVRSLQIDIEVDNSLRNLCRGLLGNNNGDPNDDFILPDGTTLSPTITERQIFQQFARKYLVTNETSAFTYNKGESTADYQHPEFVPMFYDEISPDQLLKAEEICGKSDTACIYDYTVTGSEEFAKNTKDTKIVHEERRKRFKNNPPSLTWITKTGDENYWLVNEGRINIATVKVKDVDNDTVTIELLTNIRGVVLDQNGTITYTPDLDNPISLNIRAKDSVGSYSSILRIKIAICPTCSNHGACDANASAAAEFYEGQYQILKCRCFPAYTGEACESELDGCKSLPCTEGQSCRDLTAFDQGNSTVGYVCGPCPAGTTNVDGFCDDIDECTNRSLCDQECINTYRDYKCGCRSGFVLDPHDGWTCNDINECDERTSHCEQVCTNTPGNYTCSCKNGYTLNSDGATCVIDANNAALCEHCEQVCNVGSNRQVTCGCKLGFEVDVSNPNSCTDIDECNIDGKSPCSQKCTNTEGGFVCSCNAGYKLDKNGASCLKCDSSHFGVNCSGVCACRNQGKCDRVKGCVCNEYWTGANCDKDVDECRDPKACPSGMVCLNEPGSFSCACLDGYRLDNGVCLDIDECKEHTDKCDLNLEDCYNNEGSYNCLCKEGFKQNDLTGVCEDVDECKQHIDGCDHLCENGEGSYSCACHQGFRLTSDRHSCESYKPACNFTCSHGCSIDDCGTHYCICPRGYKQVGVNSCADIDECASPDTNKCDHKDMCINTDGNYFCSCEAGFRLDNDGRSCVGCSNGTWGIECNNSCACGKEALSCDPVIGCECKPGCSGVRCTEVIDRCASGEVTCEANEECVVSGCSSVCQCAKGFVWDNGQCQDEDECLNKEHNCEQVCNNTIGSFVCSCFTGYSYNESSNTCIDVDECDESPCSKTCVNTEGSYHCTCPTGQVIQADGVTCDCPNGCEVGCSKCVENNTDSCNKTSGQCFCKKGWTSDNCTVNAEKCLRNSCPANRKCRNVNGNDECVCWNDLSIRSDGTCMDCDRTLTERSGYIMSSHYPNLYQDNTYCAWTIAVSDPEAVIELSFIDYNVEGCPTDFVTLYNGVNRAAPRLAQVCANWRTTFISKGNSLYLVFASDESDTFNGFLASYTSYVPCKTKKCSHTCSRFSANPDIEKCHCPDWMTLSQSNDSNCIYTNGCNTTITEPVGSIVSPNYPNKHPGNSNCRWTIQGGNDSFIKLSFSDFNLEFSSKCTYDSLTIYNGNNETAPLIGRFCGNNFPPVITSTGNSLLIVLRTDAANNYIGFRAAYAIFGR